MFHACVRNKGTWTWKYLSNIIIIIIIIDILGPTSCVLPGTIKVENTVSGIKLLENTEQSGPEKGGKWLNLPWRLALDGLLSQQAPVSPVLLS